ncbi:receptor-like protein kinase FERONIA [Tanacetum coccineum]
MDKANGEAENLTSSTSAQPSRRFTIADIQSATNNFDDELVIGQGGFGKVYKGQISIEDSSHFVAIKRLDSISNQGAAEFKAEIEMLSKLRHCNLVSLIGYCDDNRELILVYVYVPHGTLYDHLHKVTATALSWIQRLKIAIGAGRALQWIHVFEEQGSLERLWQTSAICWNTERPSMTQVVAKLQDLLELQEKCDNSTDSPGTSGFTWMIRKYRASATNQNSGTIRLLPLATKVKIAIGIARGIVYLCNTTDNVGNSYGGMALAAPYIHPHHIGRIMMLPYPFL